MIFLPAFGLMIWTIIAAMYFIPSAVAMVRHSQNVIAIFALNLLLGWTIIGWVAALVWALTSERAPGSIPVLGLSVQQASQVAKQPMNVQAIHGWTCRASINTGDGFYRSCGIKVAWPT